jgi:phage anti-repressor protein
MNTVTLIPIVPTTINGQASQMVDARVLHAFLEVGRDFSNWIKGRIDEYLFAEDQDYLLAKSGEQVPHQGGFRTVSRVDYFLTIDMAKEFAMVERTAKGRQARRYFLDCERQLRQLQQSVPVKLPHQSRAISRGQRQAINRQAWADVSAQAQAAFHARREALVREYLEPPKQKYSIVPLHFVPDWAR